MSHPRDPEPDPRRLSNGLGYAGFGATVLGVIVYFVPFLDVMLCLIGMVLCGRSIFSARKDEGQVQTGVALAMAGLVLGVIGLIPGAIISWDAADVGRTPPPIDSSVTP